MRRKRSALGRDFGVYVISAYSLREASFIY
jgi:hypothetical protein